MNLTKTLAALLVVLAIVLALLAWMMGSPSEPATAPVPASAPGPAAAAPPLHAVVVAAQDIPAGQRLQAEHVRLAQLPAPVPGSFDHTDAVLGRSTRVALSPGTPLFEPQLVSGLALQITPGQRALAIAIKEPMSAGHHVRPGDFVDVFFTLDARNDPAAPDSQTRLLLARSRVLAYGQASVERPPLSAAQRQAQQDEAGARRGASAASNAATREDPAQRPENAQTAVLAVPLEDVERLTLAEKFGQLTLALRHPDDLSVPDPTLFAALPTALQPVAARLRGNAPLQGPDRAFAGLRFKDLAAGGQARGTARAAPQAGRQVQQGPPPPRQASVEMHQGAAVQTVSY